MTINLNQKAAIFAALEAVSDETETATLQGLLAPFIITAALQYDKKVFGTANLVGCVKGIFGWDLPETILQDVCFQLEQNGVFFQSGDAFSFSDEAKIKYETQHQGNRLPEIIAPIREFIRLRTPLFESTIEDVSLFSAVLAFSKSGGFDDTSDDLHITDLDRECAYWVAEYVNSTQNNEPGGNKLPNWVKHIAVASNVIEYLSISQSINLAPGTVRIFLDGPVLLDALGFQKAGIAKETQEMIAELKIAGAEIFIFKHSLEEAQAISKSALNRQSQGDSSAQTKYMDLSVARYLERHDKVGRKLLEDFVNGSSSYTATALNIPLSNILNAKTLTNDSDFTHDDWSKFYNALNWYQSEMARERDCDSIASIFKLREGTLATDPWKSRALLLSSNVRLMEAAKVISVNINLLGLANVGPIMHKGAILGLLWISGNKKTGEKLSLLEIANAAGNLVDITPSWIEKIGEKLSQIGELNQLQRESILRDPVFQRIAMDRVSGKLDFLTATIVKEASVAFQEKIREEALQEARATEKQSTKIKRKIIETQKQNAIQDKRTIFEAQSQLYEERAIRAKRERDSVRIALQQAAKTAKFWEVCLQIAMIGASFSVAFLVYYFEKKYAGPAFFAFLVVTLSTLATNFFKSKGFSFLRKWSNSLAMFTEQAPKAFKAGLPDDLQVRYSLRLGVEEFYTLRNVAEDLDSDILL